MNNKDKPLYCGYSKCELKDCMNHDCNATNIYGWNRILLRDNLFVPDKDKQCKNYDKGSDV